MNSFFSFLIKVSIGALWTIYTVIYRPDYGPTLYVVAVMYFMTVYALFFTLFCTLFINYVFKKENWYWKKMGSPNRFFYGVDHQWALVVCLRDRDYLNFNSSSVFVKIAPFLRRGYILATNLTVITMSSVIFHALHESW